MTCMMFRIHYTNYSFFEAQMNKRPLLKAYYERMIARDSFKEANMYNVNIPNHFKMVLIFAIVTGVLSGIVELICYFIKDDLNWGMLYLYIWLALFTALILNFAILGCVGRSKFASLVKRVNARKNTALEGGYQEAYGYYKQE